MMRRILLFLAAAAFLSAAAEVNPLNAVVKIDTVKHAPLYRIPWDHNWQQRSGGSGLAIGNGRILTNAHVVTNATYVTVQKQSDDTKFNAKIKFLNQESDLALLEVDDKSFFNDITPLKFGATPELQENIVVAGYPMGGDKLSFTRGVVSRIEPRRYTNSGMSLLAIQIDAAVNAGNSGGPVLNDKCEVVGLIMQGFDHDKAEGLSYFIPMEIIHHFFRDIQDNKVDGFGGLGIATSNLENPAARAFLKMPQGMTGVRVFKVHRVAAPGTFQPNDVLLSLDGKAISNQGNIRLPNGDTRRFTVLLNEKQVGEKIKVKVLRDGKEVEFQSTITKNKMLNRMIGEDRKGNYLFIGGLVFTDITRELVLECNDNWPGLWYQFFRETKYDGEEVVVLTEVYADQVNAGYQDQPPAVILSVNGEKVRNFKDFVAKVDNCKTEYITFECLEDAPITLHVQELRRATPEIMKRYQIPSDRYLK